MMTTNVLPFQPPTATLQPPWRCGQHEGLPAHVWPPRAKAGDRCQCGESVMPAGFRIYQPSAREAADEALAG